MAKINEIRSGDKAGPYNVQIICRLFKPLDEMVLGPQVVDGKADPAGQKDDNGRNDFSGKGNGLLEDVKDGQNGENDADNVNNSGHND